MILRGINYFKYFYKKKKNIKNILSKYKNYLKSGVYIITPNKIYLKNSKWEKFLNYKHSFLIDLFFTEEINIKNYDEKDMGECLILSSNNLPKIFSSTHVLTFLSYSHIQKLKRVNEYVKNYFNTTYIEFKRDMVIEKFIMDEKTINLDELNTVYTLCFKFYQSQQYEIKKIDIKVLENNYNKLTQENKDFIEKLIQFANQKIPFIYTHNDIHFENILKSNNRFFFIDWEYFDKNLFFYDYLNILFVSALKGKKEFLDMYLRGGLDCYFDKLFDIFNIKYCKKKRNEYLYMYLLQKIVLRDCEEEAYHFNKVINKYKKVLKDFNC